MSTKSVTLPTGVRVKHRADGTPFYEAQIARPKLNGQRQSPLSRSFPTPEQAAAWRESELQARVAPTGPLTLAQWVARWIPTTSHLSPATRRSYETLLRLHVLPALGDQALTDIKPSALSALYADLLDQSRPQPKSRATVTRIHAATLQALKAATAEGHLTLNPASQAKLPKATLHHQAREVHAWDAHTVNAFLSSKQVARHPFSAFITLAFHTGLRRGELLALTPQDITLSAATPSLRVNRSVSSDADNTRITTVTKSAKGRRRVPLTPEAQAAVKAALQHRLSTPNPAPELFVDETGQPYRGDTVTKAFGHLVHSFTTANPAAPRLTLHGARHSFVTNLLTSGTPLATVSKLAGHASVAFTIDRYGSLLDSAADTALDGLYAVPA